MKAKILREQVKEVVQNIPEPFCQSYNPSCSMYNRCDGHGKIKTNHKSGVHYSYCTGSQLPNRPYTQALDIVQHKSRDIARFL